MSGSEPTGYNEAHALRDHVDLSPPVSDKLVPVAETSIRIAQTMISASLGVAQISRLLEAQGKLVSKGTRQGRRQVRKTLDGAQREVLHVLPAVLVPPVERAKL